MTDKERVLLTVAETARLLRRSTEQVRRYLREGALPGQRLGGQWFINQADVEAFLPRRPEGADFHQRLRESDPNPLVAVIAMGGSGGGDIALGAGPYLQALAGARRP